MANYWHLSMITLSLFFVYFALATNSFSSKQHITCNEDELSALVKFKQSFSIKMSAYSKFASWKMNGSDCCLWDGVECSEDTGHVIGLDLGSSHLYGLLNSSSSLFHLVHLQSLNLSHNDFMNSQIPSAIAFLSQLRRLDLSSSAFSGQIPKEISHLKHLASLSLKENPLLKLQNPSFKHLVQNLTELEELSLSQVSSLRFLDLSYNNLTGTIPPCLGKMIMSVLVLKGNNFCGAIPNMFMKGSMLEIIDVRENRLKGKLPRSLTNCTMLRVLDLADNSLEDVFPTWLGNLRQLQVVVLRSNKFHGELKSSQESNSHHQYTKVRIVDLSDNAFTGYLPREYIQSWTSMQTTYSNTTYLGISYFLNGVNSYDTYDYSMTITNKGVKREYEKVLNVFTVVDLSSNNFIGEIPEYFGQLQGLQLLNLSNNNLSGYIPISFQNLTNLECLDLSRNRLLGEIPQQLAHLTFLAFLNVSDNHLIGPIPQGEQFNTFQNNSYEGNLGLCGEPLSKKCGNIPIPVIDERGDDSEFPSGVDWIVISLGLGSGLVVGLIFGKYLGERHHDWFVEKFGKKQDNWVRPLRRGRRD